METNIHKGTNSNQDKSGFDEGRNGASKDVTTDSGLSNTEDCSLLSEGDSSFALLDVSDIKSDGGGSMKEKHVKGNQEVKSGTTEAPEIIQGDDSGKDMENRRRASSSASEFSLMDIAENSVLDQRELQDSTASNDFNNFKFLAKNEEQSNGMPNDEDLISCNRTNDKTSHQSSTLGSSFVVLNDPSMNSSHPSLCHLSLQQPKVQALPSKDPCSLSTSTENHMKEGKLSLNDGLEKVVVGCEGWKTNKSPNSIGNSHSKIVEKEKGDDNDGDASRKKPESRIENVNGSIPESSESNLPVDSEVQSEMKVVPSGNGQLSPDENNKNLDNNNVVQTPLSERNYSNNKLTDGASSDRRSGEDSDFSIVEEDGEESLQVVNTDFTNSQIVGPLFRSSDNSLEHIQKDKSPKHSSYNDNTKVTAKRKPDIVEVNEIKRHSESDFSPIDEEESASGQLLKLDIDNDNQSSQYTGPHSRTESSESIEIDMAEVILSDDNSDVSSQKHSSGDNGNLTGQGAIIPKIRTMESRDSSKTNFGKDFLKLESFQKIEKEDVCEGYKEADKSSLENQEDGVHINVKPDNAQRLVVEKGIEEITEGISSMTVDIAIDGDDQSGEITELQTIPSNDEDKKNDKTDQENGDTLCVEQTKVTSDELSMTLQTGEMDTCGQSTPGIKKEFIIDDREQSSYIFVKEAEKMRYDSPNYLNGSEDENIGDSISGRNNTCTAGGEPKLKTPDAKDTWQPAIHPSEMEASVTKELARSHWLTLERNVQFLSQHKSHEADVKTYKIPTVNELVSAKWRYVLTRKEKLNQHLKQHFSETSLNYDESFQKILLMRYSAFKDEQEAETWYSDVITDIENQVQMNDSYLISCSEESSELVKTKLHTLADACEYDVDITKFPNNMDASPMTEVYVIVTGACREVATVVIQLDSKAVELFISEGDVITPCTISSFPLSSTQHHVCVTFDGLSAISSEFPGTHIDFKDDAINLLIKQKCDIKIQRFMINQILKFKTETKIALKPMEFTLLCKSSVKDFVVMNIGSEIQFRWKFRPEIGEILLFTENQEELDEIKDVFTSSFQEFKIELDNELKDDDEESNVRKSSKWSDLVTEINRNSKGMADIDLDLQQTCVTITGTVDVIKSWQAFGELKKYEKFIDEYIMPVRNSAFSSNREVEPITKFVSVNVDKLHLLKETKMLEKLQQKCQLKNLGLIQTDHGFEVQGKDMSEVKSICELIKAMDAELIIPIEKIFLPMDEDTVNDICKTRYEELQDLAQSLNVEFDPTNLGFEIRGKSKVNINKFHDYLERMTESKPETKHCFQMDEEKVKEICNMKHEELKACECQLDVKLRPTNLGFEVRGKDEKSVKKMCDFLHELKVSDADDNKMAHSRNRIMEKKSDVVMPKLTRLIKLDSRVKSYIGKYKLVEIGEIISNIEVEYRIHDDGFEISGTTEDNVNTLFEHILNLSKIIETCEVNDIPELSDEELQRIEETFRCLIKIPNGTESSEPLNGEAQWNINGVDLCVTMTCVDGESCEILVKPVTPRVGGEERKSIAYQDKRDMDEVEILAPVWTEESGKSKHELSDLLADLLKDLNDKSHSMIAFPLEEFSGWQPVKLTKLILKALADFIRDNKDVDMFRKIYLYISDKTGCSKVIDAIDDAVPVLKKEGLTVSVLKRSADWTVPLVLPAEEEHDGPDLVQGQSHPDSKTSSQSHQPQNVTDTSKSKPEKPVNTAEKEPLHQDYLKKPEVVVIKGELAKQEVDAIVNTTSQDFNLKNGAVSKSLLTAAGSGIQDEVWKNCKGKNVGDIVTTKGYQLKCQYVFHGALDRFIKDRNTYKQPGVKCMEKFVRSCLETAHRLSLSCIAFPVLGAGALDFPPDVVATTILEIVKNFREKYTNTTLCTIRIVVYRDEDMYLVFKKMADGYRESLLRELGLQPSGEVLEQSIKADVDTSEALPTPVMMVQDQTVEHRTESAFSSLPQGLSLDIGYINLSARLGDVTKEKVDGLILLWPADELDTTPADKEIILKSVGKDVLMDWDTGKSSLSESKILVTPGGSLPQRTIIHVCIDEAQVEQAFKLALTKAEELRLSSVVIPVRPSDELAKDVKKFSTCIYRAVTEMHHQFRHVRGIRVCIGGKHLCQPILENLAKLHETGGKYCDVKAGCTVEVTALKDDMTTIIAQLKPIIEEPPPAVLENECDDMNKTLTNEDEKQEKDVHQYFLTNATAEVCPDIIEMVRLHGQIDILRENLKILCEKITEHNQKWTLWGSFAQLEACQNYLKDFWSSRVDETNLPSSHETKEPVVEKNEMIQCIMIYVDITKDMYNALIFLCNEELKKIIGDATVKFMSDSSSICVKGKRLPSNLADRFKEIVFNFQSTAEMDVVEIPYRQLQKYSRENFLIKLQTENPEVYVYAGDSNGAEASLQIYLVALSREELKSVKQGIRFEYMKPSNRSGRFSHSMSVDNSPSKGSDDKLAPGISNGKSRAIPSCKVYHTAEGLVVKVYLESIIQLKVDCIVNAANKDLLHGGGIAAVISKAAGQQLNKECIQYVKSYGPIPTGGCCVTNAGKLPYKRVIHAVGPQYSSRKSRECCELLQQTVERCITLANNHQLRSVAIPSISAGIYGMPGELCARCYAVAAMTVSANRRGAWALKEVHFVDNSPDMVFTVQKAFSEYFENSPDRHQERGKVQHVQFQTSVESYKGDSETIRKLKNAQTWKNVDETLSNKAPMLGYTGSPINKPNVPGRPVRQQEPNNSGRPVCQQEPNNPGRPVRQQEPNNPGSPVRQQEPNNPGRPVRQQEPNVMTGRESTKQGASLSPTTTPATREKCIVIKKAVNCHQLPASSSLPDLWKVTVKLNLINICTSKNLEVLVFEKKFYDIITQAIAFGENTDYAKSSLLVEIKKRLSIKAKLDQLKTQLTNPSVGTVAMFEAVTDIYVQKVFVVFTPKYPKNGTNHELKEFYDRLFSCYLTLFHEVASYTDIEYLAVSFLKTGNTGTSFEDGSNVFFHAVNAFSANKKSSSPLKQIHLVLNKETSALKTIKTVLEQNYAKSGHWKDIKEKVNKSTFGRLGIRTIGSGGKQTHSEVKSDQSDMTTDGKDINHPRDEPVTCVICLEIVQEDNKRVLEMCKHEFCNSCITECFKHRPVCPTCGAVYGIVRGNQPDGTMTVVHHTNIQLPGFPKHGEWYITYNFPHGTQTSEHVNPGKAYRGTQRIAYLPDNPKGTLVKDLLVVAFDRKLVFTIGHSRTTGEENVVTWNDIHHKTNRAGGPQGFGYPDKEYLDRVLDELAAKGVTKDVLK